MKVGERKKATSAAKGRREDEALANDEVSCRSQAEILHTHIVIAGKGRSITSLTQNDPHASLMAQGLACGSLMSVPMVTDRCWTLWWMATWRIRRTRWSSWRSSTSTGSQTRRCAKNLHVPRTALHHCAADMCSSCYAALSQMHCRLSAVAMQRHWVVKAGFNVRGISCRAGC